MQGRAQQREGHLRAANSGLHDWADSRASCKGKGINKGTQARILAMAHRPRSQQGHTGKGN